jgi:hypothetical protein
MGRIAPAAANPRGTAKGDRAAGCWPSRAATQNRGFSSARSSAFALRSEPCRSEFSGGTPVSCSRCFECPRGVAVGAFRFWPCLASRDIPSARAADFRVETRSSPITHCGHAMGTQFGSVALPGLFAPKAHAGEAGALRPRRKEQEETAHGSRSLLTSPGNQRRGRSSPLSADSMFVVRTSRHPPAAHRRQVGCLGLSRFRQPLLASSAKG